MQENEPCSKREQRKLAQTIKLINSLQAKEPRNIEEGSVEPKPRKKRKTSTKILIFNPQTQLKTLKADDQEQAAETKSACNLTPQHEKNQTSKEKLLLQNDDANKIDHLNPSFPLESGDVSSYLICYQYSQQQKQLDKQQSAGSDLDQLGEPIITSSHPQSLKIFEKLMTVLSECKQVLGGCPFSKHHLALAWQQR